jgi:hypothetical protein
MEQVQSVVKEVLGRDSTAYGIPATTKERMGVCPARPSPAGAGGDVAARGVPAPLVPNDRVGGLFLKVGRASSSERPAGLSSLRSRMRATGWRAELCDACLVPTVEAIQKNGSPS